jgi:dihydrofolate reductase
MGKVVAGITSSLDGFVAGPEPSLEQPLGSGGELLHQWLFGLASWSELHGGGSGERNADDDVVRESLETTGAQVMGRRMFSGGSGAWETDPVANGWWGDDPPFRVPVFVLTHHPREPLTLGQSTFVFVTDGLEAALEQARAAAGERNVFLAGGASVIQQALVLGQLDEIEIHYAPLLLGGGTRLFEDFTGGPLPLEVTRVVSSPAVTHVRYRVAGVAPAA